MIAAQEPEQADALPYLSNSYGLDFGPMYGGQPLFLLRVLI